MVTPEAKNLSVAAFWPRDWRAAGAAVASMAMVIARNALMETILKEVIDKTGGLFVGSVGVDVES